MDFNSFSDILFAHPGFLSGMSRVLDMGSTFTFYNYHLTPNEADGMALKGDVFTVGNDIRFALSQCSNK